MYSRTSQTTVNRPRPYRSRRIPACTRCRTRRSKCTVDVIGKSCLLCRKHGVLCSASLALQVSSLQRVSPDEAHEEQTPADLHVVPPMVARDTQALEELLPSTSDEPLRADAVAGHTHKVPLYHVSITRRPSPAHCECSQNLPLQLISQTASYFEQILQLYFSDLYLCLPMLEEQVLRTQLSARSGSRTLLVNLLAYSMFHWNLSPALQQHSRPDQDFAWQAACTAMNGSHQTGGLLSIVAAALNIAGRPSKGVVHNMANVARIVALSNSIGLNHDCRGWQISELEKRSRWKVWWVVLVQDRWFNFAQGTPPLINAAHYDVPLPNEALLIEDNSAQQSVLSAQCYIALCRLTEILGDILPLIYHVRSGSAGLVAKQVAKSREDLDSWLQNVPDGLRLLDLRQRPYIQGLVNLQLSFLSVEMLLRRLDWYEQSQADNDNEESALRNCQRAAEDVVDFATSLTPSDLTGFWLPYNAQHFTSAVTLLLRCALQTAITQVRKQCLERAYRLVNCLRDLRDSHAWDLAEIALPQSEMIIRKVEDRLPKLNVLTTVRSAAGQAMQSAELPPIEEFNPSDELFDPLCEESLEDLFPGVFSSFDDYAFFDQIFS